MDKLELEKIELFKGLNIEELEQQLSNINMKILKYKKGNVIAFRDEVINGLYINFSGEVSTEMLKDNGESKKIEEIKSGKTLAAAFIFGEYNYFPVDIIAKTNVEILYIEKKELLNLLVTNKKLLVKFLDEISEKAHFLSKNLWESVAKKSIEQKFANYLLVNEKNNLVELKITLTELAEYFNVTRPSLSRVINQMIEEKILLRVRKGVYKIENKNYLKSL